MYFADYPVKFLLVISAFFIFRAILVKYCVYQGKYLNAIHSYYHVLSLMGYVSTRRALPFMFYQER
jgi:hypothetical protein